MNNSQLTRPTAVVAAIGFVLALTLPVYGDFIDGPVKWSQPITVEGFPVDPQETPLPAGTIIDGQDWNSDHSTTIVRADDFTSDGRPIEAVRWWGSYIGDPDQRQDGLAFPFDISFHWSDGGAHPLSLPQGDAIVIYTVVAQEVYVGRDAVGDAVYRYDAYLPEPFPEEARAEYFIDICKPTGESWGWHETALHIQDFSAIGLGHAGPWFSTQEFDLAFELIAVPEPATWMLLLVGGFGLLSLTRVRRTA